MQIQITGCMFENMGRNMNTKSKVIVLPCEAYDEERIYTLMKNGLSQLGGLDNLINKEEKILLKPNLLKKAEVEKAVITHPVVVGAFARILREEGYKRYCACRFLWSRDYETGDPGYRNGHLSGKIPDSGY